MNIAPLIINFYTAKTAWLVATDETNDRCESPEWAAFIAAELAVFQAPCETMEDVQDKARAILADAALFDALVNDGSDHNHRAAIFLRSLLGEVAS